MGDILDAIKEMGNENNLASINNEKDRINRNAFNKYFNVFNVDKGNDGWLLLYFLYFFSNLVYLFTVLKYGGFFFLIILALNLYCLILFLRELKSAIFWNKLILYFNLIGSLLVVSVYNAGNFADFVSIISYLIVNILWLSYWYKSERVKNTFVNSGINYEPYIKK